MEVIALVLGCILLAFSQNAPTILPVSPPLVTIKNGTLRGFHVKGFDQIGFFGIPFAAPPLGDLRLRHPQPFNEAFSGVRDATKRSLSCPGFGSFADGLDMGEDCLTLDVVLPVNIEPSDTLPVLVWIYGGGFVAGGTADPRYNMSYVVQNSADIGKPIITVAINYRTMGLGLLASKEIMVADAANIALYDQRLALRWIRENIAAFGGDPSKVTIWGESAGGSSVGYHLTAFNGKSDGLFRAALIESGIYLGLSINTIPQLATTYQPIYDNVTRAVGCENSIDSLACLRTVPFQKLYNALVGLQFLPIVDGKFIPKYPSESIAAGQIADVAILIGSNTDECTATFFTPRGTLNTDDDVYTYLAGYGTGLDNNTIKTVMDLYPDDPALGCPFGTGVERFADQGFQFKRGAAISGDSKIHAGTRFLANYYAKNGTRPVYKYRFDQQPWNNQEVDVATVPPVSVTHYTEICFVFDNLNHNVNWIGPYPSYARLAHLMSRAWVSFAHDLNPNNHGVGGVPQWPEYRTSPSNIVFRADKTTVETDDFRTKQLAFWGSIWGLLGS